MKIKIVIGIETPIDNKTKFSILIKNNNMLKIILIKTKKTIEEIMHKLTYSPALILISDCSIFTFKLGKLFSIFLPRPKKTPESFTSMSNGNNEKGILIFVKLFSPLRNIY